MGLYNYVIGDVACRSCGCTSRRDLQLHYGAKNLHRYHLGDRLNWLQGVCEGEPVDGRVWCPCYATPCPNCGDDPPCAIFAVVIDRGVIAEIHQAPIGHVYPEHPTWTLLSDTAQPTPVLCDGP